VWLTVFAFSSPAFYVLFRIGKPEIFDSAKLEEKFVGSIGIVLIVWFIYGIACVLATPHERNLRNN
jgi:hypothetical protein